MTGTGDPRRDRLVLAACCLGQFLVICDASVVNVALPVLESSLGFGSADLHWVVNAYTIALCGFLMLGGRLADLLGRRRVFLVALVVFGLASLLGGLAGDPATLIGARALQGLGAAALTPTSLAILGTTFTEPAARARAFSLWGAAAGSGGAVGVLAGGVIVEVLSWRWIFMVNLPICAALLAVSRAGIAPDRRPERPTSPDVLGALSLTAGLTCTVLATVGVERYGWTGAPVLVPLLAGILLLALFVVDQRHLATHPLVPPRIVTGRALIAANVAGAACGAAFFGIFYFLALLLQNVVGYSSLQVGLAFLPLSLGVFAGARAAAPAVPRFGARPVLILAQLLGIAGLVWLSLADAGSRFVSDLLGPCVLLGLGQGLVITSLTAAATASVPPDHTGLASGLLNTTRQLGCAVGLAGMVAVSAAAPGRAAGYSAACLTGAVILLVGLGAAGLVPGGVAARASVSA